MDEFSHAWYRARLVEADEVYREELGRPLVGTGDVEGVSLRMFQQREHGHNRAALVRSVRDSAEWRLRQPAPPDTPVPDTPSAPMAWLPPLAGQLRFDGVSFADNTGRRVPLALHLGDLAMCYVEGKEVLVHEALADARDVGYQIVRIWLTINWRHPHPFWGGRTLSPATTPDYHRRMTEFLRIVAEDYGLQLHVTLGDSFQVSHAEEDALWHWLKFLVRDHPTWFALIEGLNEAYGTGDRDDWDPAEIERQIQIVRTLNPSHLYALSAAAGENSESVEELVRWTPALMPFFYYHAYRGGHWFDQMRHVFSLVYEHGGTVRRNGWSGEPPGVNLRSYYDGATGPGAWVSGMDHPEEWTAQRYALYLAHTAMSRQLPTFMCSHGVKLEGRLRDVPGFVEAPRLIAHLPPNVMAYDELFHGGQTFADRRVLVADDDELRIDHAHNTATGDLVMTVYGPSRDRNYTIPIERPWRGRMVAGGVVRENVELVPGRTLPLVMGDGALLVGRRIA